jgi:hypothetical protein
MAPAAPVTGLAPPSRATQDARLVGLLVRASWESGPVFAAALGRRSAAVLTAAAAGAARIGRDIEPAARSLRPSTTRGRRIRKRLRVFARAMDIMATELRRFAGSVRRGDRRAADRHEQEIAGAAVAIALVIASADKIAGLSQAGL